MRARLLFLALCAACNCAAQCDTLPPDSVLRADITTEELEAGPTFHHMKGALLNDVRIWRELDKKIATEGYKEPPKAIDFTSGVPVCHYDQTDYEVYSLKSDLADQPYRVEETAYFCKKESVYYYQYRGGPKKLNLWMGPYRLERKRAKTDDH